MISNQKAEPPVRVLPPAATGPGGAVSFVLLGLLVVLMFATFIVLRNAQVTNAGMELNIDRACFQIANATSLSGFQLTSNVGDYKPLGQAIIFALSTASTLVMLIVGGWGLTRAAGMPFTDRQVAYGSIMLYLISTLVAVTFMGWGIDVRQAFFQVSSALGNFGSVIGPQARWSDGHAQVLLLLGVIGGLGVPVVLDLAGGGVQRRSLHPHTIAVLLTSAGVYVAGVLLILLVENFASAVPVRQTLIVASVEALNERSIGMPLGAFSELSRAAQWIAMMLMIIGASPAGTGGGIKGTTLYVVGRDSVRLIRNRPIDRALGIACAWIGAYLLLALATLVALTIANPQMPGEQLLCISFSALSNVGTSLTPLTMTGQSLYILSAAMLLGRFLPLCLLWWQARTVAPVSVAVG